MHKIHKEKCGKAREFWKDDQTVTGGRQTGRSRALAVPGRFAQPQGEARARRAHRQNRNNRSEYSHAFTATCFIPAMMKKHLNNLHVYRLPKCTGSEKPKH